MSAIGLSLVTFFGIKKNIVVQACCGHFPLCPTFSKSSTISPVVPLSSPRRPLGGSRRIPLLFSPCTGKASSTSSIPQFSKARPPHSGPPHHTANLPTLSSLLHNGPTTLLTRLAILSEIRRNQAATFSVLSSPFGCLHLCGICSSHLPPFT